MDSLNEYRRVIREVIRDYERFEPSVGEVQSEVVFDEANDHYELVHSGWNGIYRIHGSVLHIDIRDGKVWIQHDGTPDGIADTLVAAGIPRDHIVLAYKHPEIRPHTGFARA
jgi:hypothetical protein